MLLGQWYISVILILRSIHYTCFHSVIKCWIIFEGSSSNSEKIFTLRKKIVSIMVGIQPRTSCRCLLKQLEILPVPCQYILSLMNFIINNQEIFRTNSLIHNINTRNKHYLRRSNASLSCFQRLHSMLA